ncbi:hypothetical protein V8G54_036616 [Vigna mungo]|uniref:Uncharacterized protein n=1 Tax=Vigna mungo TaxID=3915 RepID=A0AAQ3MHA5_VIGMU
MSEVSRVTGSYANGVLPQSPMHTSPITNTFSSPEIRRCCCSSTSSAFATPSKRRSPFVSTHTIVARMFSGLSNPEWCMKKLEDGNGGVLRHTWKKRKEVPEDYNLGFLL